MGVNFAVVVVMFALGVFVVIVISLWFVAEQRAFQFLTRHFATGGFRQGEQRQGFSSWARTAATLALSASVVACSKPTRFIAGLSSSSSRV
jgi:hypothetical protein